MPDLHAFTHQEIGDVVSEDAHDYGHQGVMPEPQWSSKWNTWTAVQREAYLQDVRRWKCFSKEQVIDILQGLPPRPSGWESPLTCLAEYEKAVDRFRYDLRHGLVPPSLTRAEFAAWCVCRGVDVPDVLAADSDGPFQAGQAVAESQTKFAPWIPLPGAAAPAVARRKPRGRPRVAAVRNLRHIEIATEFLLSSARAGVLHGLREVAEHVAASRYSEGVRAETIQRYLKNRLPLAQARAIATEAMARAREPRRTTRPDR